MNIGVVAAMPQEFEAFSEKKANIQQPVQIRPGLCGIISGMGGQYAAKAVEQLYQFDSQLQGIISWGVAAALTPKLITGNLIVPSTLITSKGRIHRQSSELYLHLCDKLNSNFYVRTDLLHAETASVLHSAADKAQLFKNTNAHSADMESGALATFCDNQNLHFAVVRVISDGSKTAIPRIINKSSGADGQVNIIKLLGLMLLHPNQIPQMVQVAKDFGKAKKQLSEISKLIKPE